MIEGYTPPDDGPLARPVKAAYSIAVFTTLAAVIITMYSDFNLVTDWIVDAQIAVFGGYSAFATTMLVFIAGIGGGFFGFALLHGWKLVPPVLRLYSLPGWMWLAISTAIGAAWVAAALMMTKPVDDFPRFENTTAIELAAKTPLTRTRLDGESLPDAMRHWMLPEVMAVQTAKFDTRVAYTPIKLASDAPGTPLSVFIAEKAYLQPPETAIQATGRPIGYVRRERLPIAIGHQFEQDGIAIADTTYVMRERLDGSPRAWAFGQGTFVFVLGLLIAIMRWFGGPLIRRQRAKYAAHSDQHRP